MICKECGIEVEVIGRTTHYYKPTDKRLIASTHDIPFYCTLCGAIKFSYKAIRGVVFVWPFYQFDDRFRKKSDVILIPDTTKKQELSDIGIILSYGPGFYDKKHRNKWRKVIGLSVGMKIIYDKNVPWSVDIKGNDNLWYNVKICDFTDVLVEVV